MDFALDGADKLKATLSRQDLEGLSLSVEDMKYSDEKTRALLVALLNRGREQVGFSPRKAKLFVEVYPLEEGGCVIHFTALRGLRLAGRRGGLEPVIFRFDNIDTLCEGAAALRSRYGHRIHKSSLFRMGEEYLLAVHALDYADQLSSLFLSEYGERLGEGDVLASYIEEHGELMVRDTAVDLLAEMFG